MKIIMKNTDMVMTINDETTYNIGIQTIDGFNISCNGFKSIQACMEYAKLFKQIRGRI